MNMDNNLLLKAEDLSKSYGSGHTRVDAVKAVSLEIMCGELVLIMGPSGSGKTTLLSMLGGLLTPTSGKINIADVEITKADERILPDIRARQVGFIFQSFNLLDALTVRDNIIFPAQLIPEKMEDAKKRTEMLIERLGLQKRCNALPETLSGGEKQRVAIARALINEPPLILADEPTGNLDSQSGQDVMMILHDIARDEGRSILLVTHDPRVEEISDRILWLEDGKLRDRRKNKHEWTNCPVCKMRIDAWTAILKTEYKSKQYIFCSNRCFERFQANPDNYV